MPIHVSFIFLLDDLPFLTILSRIFESIKPERFVVVVVEVLVYHITLILSLLYKLCICKLCVYIYLCFA